MFPEIFGDQVTIDMEMHTVTDQPGEPGLERLGAFVAGFWLTEAFDLCTGSDEDKKYWIPPAAIYMIEVYDRPEPIEEEELDLGKYGEDPAVPEII